MGEPFSPGWLSLREPIDAAARSVELTGMISSQLPQDRRLEIVDLGAGTGSNLRYLIERLPPHQHWVLIDQDADLLAGVRSRTLEWAAARGYHARPTGGGVMVTGDRLECHIETRRLDLTTLEPQSFAGQDLVTGSALLDLVSDRWLHRLATACAASAAAVLFGLSYNGEARCVPAEEGDERVRELMNEHQRGDKGFGPAAGPAAAGSAVSAFERAGYVVRCARSDWRATPDRTAFQAQLFEGWQRAAAAVAPDESPQTRDWLARRLAHLAAGCSEVIVGHEDLAAWPGRNLRSAIW